MRTRVGAAVAAAAISLTMGGLAVPAAAGGYDGGKRPYLEGSCPGAGWELYFYKKHKHKHPKKFWAAYKVDKKNGKIDWYVCRHHIHHGKFKDNTGPLHIPPAAKPG